MQLAPAIYIDVEASHECIKQVTKVRSQTAWPVRTQDARPPYTGFMQPKSPFCVIGHLAS